jgi:UDP-N-acetylmuramyl pentapeptide phosphotransferase/UDP-N-acetylglucosamine-1-phosphate transferase
MTPIIQTIIAFLIACAFVYFSVPVIVRLSVLKKLYDVPNERKMNKTAIPNLGGVALFIGITLAALLSIYKYDFHEFRYILAGTIIMFFIGVKDDIQNLSARKKLIAQMFCALILIIPGNIRFTDLHGILGINEINYAVSFIVSFIIIVSIINAFNMIDGIDGLASAIGILASLILGSLFIVNNQYEYSILCFAMTGSLIPFFIYNVFGRKNKIIMGDSGSLILGFLFAVLIIRYNEISLTSGPDARNFSPVLSLAIFIIPVFDMVRLIVYRIFQRKSPFLADVNHIHHKILKLGSTHLKTTLIILIANLILIGIVVAFSSVNNNLMLFVLILLTGLFSFIPRILSKSKRKS